MIEGSDLIGLANNSHGPTQWSTSQHEQEAENYSNLRLRTSAGSRGAADGGR